MRSALTAVGPQTQRLPVLRARLDEDSLQVHEPTMRTFHYVWLALASEKCKKSTPNLQHCDKRKPVKYVTCVNKCLIKVCVVALAWFFCKLQHLVVKRTWRKTNFGPYNEHIQYWAKQRSTSEWREGAWMGMTPVALGFIQECSVNCCLFVLESRRSFIQKVLQDKPQQFRFYVCVQYKHS